MRGGDDIFGNFFMGFASSLPARRLAWRLYG